MEAMEPMHLFIVNRELNYFDQVHPQSTGNAGQYSIRHTFPAPGDYILYNELDLGEDGHDLYRFDVPVVGTDAARLAPDMGPKKSNGYLIELEPLGEVKAGQTSRFVALLSRDGTGGDLESLVGAESHVAILDSSAGSFSHIDAEMSDIGFGPSVGFAHRFERPGLYKLWLRFTKGDKVTTVDWVVDVK